MDEAASVADAAQASQKAKELEYVSKEGLKEEQTRTASVSFSETLKDETKQTPRAGSEAQAHWSAVQVALGDFMETVEAQAGLVLLITFDVCVSAVRLYLQMRGELAEARQSRHYAADDLPVTSPFVELAEAIITRVLSAFSTLAMGVFVLELVVLFIVFKRQFVAHAGYTFDAVLVVVMIAIETWTDTKGARLAGVLRVWRVFRVVSIIVERERDAHDEARAELQLEKANTMQLRMEKLTAEESLKREYASREGLERLLYDYKDEVATLKEALEIAAQAVAEAEMTNAYRTGETAVSQMNETTATQIDEQQYNSSSIGEEVYQAHIDGQDASEDNSYDAYYEYRYGEDKSMEASTDLSIAEEKQSVLSDDPESDFEDAIESAVVEPSEPSG